MSKLYNYYTCLPSVGPPDCNSKRNISNSIHRLRVGGNISRLVLWTLTWNLVGFSGVSKTREMLIIFVGANISLITWCGAILNVQLFPSVPPHQAGSDEWVTGDKHSWQNENGQCTPPPSQLTRKHSGPTQVNHRASRTWGSCVELHKYIHVLWHHN